MNNTERFRGKIGVIGAGALGALYGARMARAGYDVHLLARSDYKVLCEKGLEVRSWQGNFHIMPNAHPSAEAMGKCDLLLIGLKATQNGELERLLEPTTHAGTLVITLQNGLGNEEAITSALEKIHGTETNCHEQVLGAVAFLCSTRIAPGIIDHSDHGRIRLAEFSGPIKARTHSLARLFTDAEFPCELADSLRQIRWEKLMWNIPFSGLGTASECADASVMLGTPELLESSVALMHETIAIAKADGVLIPETFIETMLNATRSIGTYKASMILDYEAGRPLEVEAILGEAWRRAQRHGVSAPLLRAIYAIVRRMNELNQSH